MKIQTGERFPTIEVDVLEGDPITIPDDLEGMWSIVLFYRGHF